MIAIIISLAFTGIYARWKEQKQFVRLQKLYSQYNLFLSENKQLHSQYSEYTSLLKVEKIAQKKLNMIWINE
ncbi:hypothetical protein MNB_SUP05-5-1046 [hydrothermal vent metagenome]|uniref:Cell division protein FtsL n=1 Tax=hydrothermal vent metagenome TaxID=652676 RepID=A0A1W1CGY8_9ZZZZ